TFLAVDALPTTVNGKVDRTASVGLQGKPLLEDAHTEPENQVEQLLADIWRDVLGLATVGTQDSFFALGGDSIRSVRVAALAQEKGLSVSVHQIFRNQTIRALARELQKEI